MIIKRILIKGGENYSLIGMQYKKQDDQSAWEDHGAWRELWLTRREPDTWGEHGAQ